MGMFSQNELLLMIFVVGVLLVFITILTILDIREYLKNKNAKLDNLFEDESVMEEVEPEKLEEVEMVEIAEPKEEVVEIASIKEEVPETDLFEEFGEETYNVEEKPVEAVIEEEKKAVEPEISYTDFVQEEVPTRVNLNEELIKANETMVEENEIENHVVSFEEEQERTAIISLDELLKKSDDLYSENEVVQYDDGNEPISIDEVIKMYNKEEKEVELPEVMETVMEEEETIPLKKDIYVKKEDIPFISSIYGIEKNEMAFENTATYEKLDREKSNEFMRELKEKIENQ